MFDKFIESNSEADKNPRRNYFLVSTIIVGILFATGVIASIYAQDIGLGTDEFELSRILTPINPVAEPEPPREQPQQQTTSPDRIVRQANILRPDESPIIPTTTSVVPNTQAHRPNAPFELGAFDTPSFSNATPGVPASPINSTGTGTFPRPSEPEVVTNEPKADPPPVIKPKAPISKGVVNGLAIELPKPMYSKMAQSVGAGGDVTVQVLIDEKGTVVSAKALKGHPLLLQESERAARRAKFKPTLLSEVPVKVTGVITYRFTK